MTQNLLKGAQYLLTGFNIITKPGIRLFVIIPLIVNILLFTLLFIFARHYINEFNAWFTGYLPSWLAWLSVILWCLFVVSFFLIMVYTFTLIANAISAPFNGFLSEKVEMYLTGKTQDPRTLAQNIKDIPRILGRQFSILIYYLPRVLALLLLFFIPVIQVFAAILWFLFHAWFMAMIYIDYPTDNHRINMITVRQWMSENRALMLGFGLSVLTATLIPILNFVTIPAAVAGATALWIDTRSPEKRSSVCPGQ